MENGQQSRKDPEEQSLFPEKLSDSIWRPWYAKLWWVAIPIYWLPAGGPTGIDVIDAFYRSKLFPYTSTFFLPLTAFLILAFGYLSRRLESAPGERGTSNPREMHRKRLNHIEPTMNSHDPASGWRWTQRRMHNRNR